MSHRSRHRRATPRAALLRWALWFAAANALVIMGLIVRFLRFAGPLQGLGAKIYLGLTLMGHPFLLAYAAALLLLVPLIVVCPYRWVVWTWGVLAAGTGICLLLLDDVVYAQYRFHLNAVVLELVIGGGGELFDFSRATWTRVALAVSGVFTLQAVLAAAIWRWRVPRRPGRMSLALGMIIVAALVAGNIIHAWADATYYRPVTALTRHIPLFYPLTAKHFLQRHGWIDQAAQRERRPLNLEAGHSGVIRYPLDTLRCQGPATTPYNLVWVLIDSWRFDMLTPAVTPQMYGFNARHPVWRFNHHVSGGNGTRIGVFSLFYGLYGVHWDVMTQEQIGPVLIDEMLRRGYQPGIFASAKLTTPPFDRTVFRAVDPLRLFSAGASAWKRDRSVVRDWRRWMDARDLQRPFFSFLFFDAIHTYSLPPNYPRLFEPMWEQVDYLALDNDFDATAFLNRYKTTAHFVDHQVGQVLTELEARGLLENTVIVFTGDHGQEFNENRLNYWGHGGNYTRYQVQVPLVVYWPGRGAKSIDYPTSHLDVVPTLMQDLFGCVNPVSDYSDGRHLLDPEAPDWLLLGGYFNRAIQERDRITMMYATGNYELFDLQQRPLEDAHIHPEVVQGVLENIARFYREVP